MAETVVGPERTLAGPISEPYRPSWVNVLNEWFERLPGPTWLVYLAAMAAGAAASFGALFLDPGLPAADPFPIPLLITGRRTGPACGP